MRYPKNEREWLAGMARINLENADLQKQKVRQALVARNARIARDEAQGRVLKITAERDALLAELAEMKRWRCCESEPPDHTNYVLIRGPAEYWLGGNWIGWCESGRFFGCASLHEDEDIGKGWTWLPIPGNGE